MKLHKYYISYWTAIMFIFLKWCEANNNNNSNNK